MKEGSGQGCDAMDGIFSQPSEMCQDLQTAQQLVNVDFPGIALLATLHMPQAHEIKMLRSPHTIDERGGKPIVLIKSGKA